jgi:hypothetical protein
MPIGSTITRRNRADFTFGSNLPGSFFSSLRFERVVQTPYLPGIAAIQYANIEERRGPEICPRTKRYIITVIDPQKKIPE